MAPLRRGFLLLTSLLASIAQAQDYKCSRTKQCALGCCRLEPDGTGNCGLGPTFCGQGNCTSTCDQKSECDPGWGAEWSTREKCPLNVCCSQYGFCGTTQEFCGSNSVPQPSCGTKTTNGRTIGYYEGWSKERPCQSMSPDQIPLGYYTHLNLAFAYIDPNTYMVAQMDDTVAAQYLPTTAVKSRQPGLEVWLSFGGWTFNDPGETAQTFSKLAASESAQKAFFDSLTSTLARYHFDGVDIDWEYPVADDRSGSPDDYQNFVSFLQNLRTALDNSGAGRRYGLSITIPSSYWYLQHFDIVKIDPIIDWFNMMTYDLHGTWDGPQDRIGSIALAHTNLTEIKQSFDLLWRNNIDPSKVNMGLGFYGRSFTLKEPGCKDAGCPFSKGGNSGECTQTAGILSYTEIDDIIKAGATVTTDQDAAIEIVTWGNDQWVSYDDQKTFAMKFDYANSRCIGGTIVWAVDLDADGSAIGNLGKGGNIPEHTHYNDSTTDPPPDLPP